MTTPQLRDLKLPEFAARLAEKSPTPGGGSVAAHLAQLGCALGCMAFRFSTGPKFAAVEAQMNARAEELERIGAQAAPLIDEDSRAYEGVMAGYRLPKTTEAEKAERSAAIQAGLGGAIQVPAETLALARRGLELLAAGAPEVNPNVASDCASGAWCLLGAAEAAFLNVRINAASLSDKAAGAVRLAACEVDLRRTRAAAESLRATIDAKLG
ncbi:MAG: cyclodeaminase/cyclohydrolase family protein [Planctomycetes bacterium]|nr:cyclodeaminase/cyclohydrolase family protein [Planctomycetota bacterium]